VLSFYPTDQVRISLQGFLWSSQSDYLDFFLFLWYNIPEKRDRVVRNRVFPQNTYTKPSISLKKPGFLVRSGAL
jgi:hypothetical protein